MEGDVSNNGECSTEYVGLVENKSSTNSENMEAELRKLAVLHLGLIHQQSEVISSKEKVIARLQAENDMFRQRALRLERKLALVLEKSKKQSQVQGGEFYGFSQSSGETEPEAPVTFWPPEANQVEVQNTGHAASFSDVFHDFATSHVISDIEVESHIPLEERGDQEVDTIVTNTKEVVKVDASTDSSDLERVRTICHGCVKLRRALLVKTECCFLASGRLCAHSSGIKRERFSSQGSDKSQESSIKIEKRIRFKDEYDVSCQEEDKILSPNRSPEMKGRKRVSVVAKIEKCVKNAKSGESVKTKKDEVKPDFLLSPPTPTVRWKRTATTKVTWETDTVTKQLFAEEASPNSTGTILGTPTTEKKKIDPDLVPETSKIHLTDEPYHIAYAYPSASARRIEKEQLVSTVEIPSFCVRAFTPVYTMEGTEPLGDDVYEKRHAKYDADEKKRKRWDHQRIREHREYLRLRSRYESDDEDGSSGKLILKSFAPDPLKVDSVGVYPKLPVNLFGMPLPKLEKKEFYLPWRVVPSEEDMELRPKRRKFS